MLAKREQIAQSAGMGKWFKEEVEKNKLSVWVFYRGIW